jgi:hypothetical protein
MYVSLTCTLLSARHACPRKVDFTATTNSDARINFRLSSGRRRRNKELGALVFALRQSLWISQQFGVRAVEVDALDDAARNFYLKYGFRPLLDDPRRLFLPMHEIRKLKLDPIQ